MCLTSVITVTNNFQYHSQFVDTDITWWTQSKNVHEYKKLHAVKAWKYVGKFVISAAKCVRNLYE